MNIYDTANQLAKELKQSNEFIEYKKVKEELYLNLEIKEKLEEFEKIKYEVQVLSLKGEEQNAEKLTKLQELYAILAQNESVKRYFDLEVRFNVLITDINKIIGEAVKEVLQ